MQTISARTKHLLIVFYVALTAALASSGIDQLQRFEPDPLTIAPRTEPEHRTLRPGDDFTFQRTVCVTKDVIVTVHREIYDPVTADRFMLKSVSYGAKKEDGCFNVEFAAFVPAYVPPGDYEYRPLLIYTINPRAQVAKPAPVVFLQVIK